MVFTAKGGIKNGAEGAVPPQWNGTSYLPRAEPSTRPGGVSRSRTEPLAPRAERPGGAINPQARKGVSTFGNTGKHRPGPDPDRAERRLNPQAPLGLVQMAPAHFFLAREGFLVSAIQAVKSSGDTWSTLSAQGFHFSDFFRLWTMSSVFMPVCCSRRKARRIQWLG